MTIVIFNGHSIVNQLDSGTSSFCAGTNVEEARKILNESGLAITNGVDFEDAARKAVASLKK